VDSRLAIDTGVLLLYFVIIIFIGLRMGRKEDNLEDFALGGRRIPWWAVLASLIAAETSAGTFFGTPGEGFSHRDYTYLQLAFGTIIGRILVSSIFIKPYYDYKVFSIYEYLTARFGVASKNAASAVFMITRLLASGTRLYVAAIALALAYEMITGARPNEIVILTAIYTTLGGIKAVIWTDLIQASIMIGSALAALALLYFAIPGGWHEIVQRRGDFQVSDLLATGLDPARQGWDKWKGMFETEYTIFAGLIGAVFITMGTHGTDQDMVQRMLTAPDYRKSQLSLILSGVMDLPIAASFLTVGILLSVFYNVVPGKTPPTADNEIFGYYIVHEMPVVFRGLIIAGVFATMMGSTSAALNALATSFTKDFYFPYVNPGASDRQAIRAARIATAVFGVLMILVAAMAANAVLQNAKLTIIPIAIGILGYTYGALLAVFLLGMLTRTRGRDGVNVVAMIIGIASVLILCKISLPAFDVSALLHGAFRHADWNFGALMPVWWPAISWPWFVFVGCVVTFAISILFPTPPNQIIVAQKHVRAQTSV
jgi:SSS family solute:Na+ symporter